MSLPLQICVPAGEPVPAEYAARSTKTIPAVRLEDVEDIRCEVVDVTSHESKCWREFALAGWECWLRGGVLFDGGQEELRLALAGGGTYVLALLNPVSGCETREEFEEREWARQLALEEEMEMEDYERDLDHELMLEMEGEEYQI